MKVTSKKRKAMSKIVAGALSLALFGGLALPSLTANAAGYDLKKSSGPDNLSYNGKFYSDYNSLEEVFQAAKELNGEIVAEGTVLMKNDGTLPLDVRHNAVSVLGVRSGDLREGVDGILYGENAPIPMAEGLRNAGFKVNPVLESWYKSLPDDQRLEMEEVGVEGHGPQFSEAVKRSIHNYNDAAIVVIQRCDFKENVDGSVALTGYTTNTGSDVDDMVNGPFAGNRPNDTLREIQDPVVGEDEKAPYGWEHAHSAQSPAENGEDEYKLANGNVEVKHELQLTSSEIDLIEYAKENFKKVVVLFNSSHTFEMYNLEHDPQINALLWFGRPGAQETGVTAVVKILSGEINPSGGHSAEYVRDFTADPTWYNSITGRQFRYGAYSEDVPGDFVYRYPDDNGKYLTIDPGSTGIGGIRGIDYEEGIYLGYKYYETYWYEISQGHTALTKDAQPTEYQQIADAWHDFNVVYPFGFGLSYTTFEFEMGGIYTDKALKTAVTGTIDGADFASSVGHPAKVKKLYIPVTVTNTGDVAGKKAVQIYVTAPYDESSAPIEKSYVKLVGFAKTDNLKPGKSQTVVVEVDVQDVASFDYNDVNKNSFKGWELEKGEYTFRAMGSSSQLRSERADEYDDASFTLSKGVTQALDNFSDNEAKPLFSDENDIDYSIRSDKFNASKDAGMTILSRSDWDNTQPAPPTVEDLTVKQEVIDRQKKVLGMNTANNFNDYFGTEKGAIDNDKQPWYVKEIPENWTQLADANDKTARPNGKAKVQLYQMAGVPLDGSIKVEGDDEFTWDDFMNQLTYAEMKGLWGSTPGAIDAIGKVRDSNTDRPLNLGQTYTWADAPLQAATWNVELIRRLGELVGEFDLQKGTTGTSGWWGPGTNTNRSQFAGRTKEYYSQDGILAGYMAAASIAGAQSKGTNVYIKHMALYDQEDMNAGTTVWVDEQTMRENYLVSFKKAIQDGHSAGAMVSCWRLGQVQLAHNYDFITGIFTTEYGWMGEWVTDHTGGQNSPAWTNPAAPTGETKYNWPSGNFNSQEILLRNSGLTIMGSGSGALKGVWDATLRNGKGGVMVDYGTEKKESVEEYYYMRMMALKGLYKAANSKLVSNGIDLSALKDQNAELTQGTAANLAAPMSADAFTGSVAVYSLTGALPAGLAFNASTGAITGTPTEIGEKTLTLNLTVDGWIKKSVNYKINVKSPWTTDFPEVKAGEEFDGSVASNITVAGGTLEYAVASGSLPEGLQLNKDTGAITGTPTTAGEYKFTIAAKYSVRQGWSSVTTTYTSEEFTLTIAGEGSAQPAEVEFRIEGGKLQYKDGETWKDVAAAAEAGKTVEKFEIKDGNLIVTYSDNTTADLGKVVGENGKDGADGAKGDKGETGATGPAGPAGPAGADGKSAEGGCGSVIGAGSAIIAAITILGAGAFVLKKKNDK